MTTIDEKKCSLTVLSMIVSIAAGCIDPLGGASDVPCLTIPQWKGILEFRTPDDDLLITVQSEQDGVEDAADGQIDHIPHSRVYRFDTASESFAVVPDEEWDNSEEDVELCCLLVLEVGAFVQSGTTLRFNGQPVEVAGGAVVKMSPSPSRQFLAVLSVNGSVLPFHVSTGQHFHQEFSLETGDPIGPALKLSIGGRGNSTVQFDWTENERFVVYENAIDPNNNGGTRICVVDRNRQ